MKKPGKFPRGVINPSSLSSSIDPERSEKVIISVLKSYLAQFGSFKSHILYFHGSFVEKFEVIEDKCTISHIRCCQCFTNGCGFECGHLAFIFVYKVFPVNDLAFAR